MGYKVPIIYKNPRRKPFPRQGQITRTELQAIMQQAIDYAKFLPQEVAEKLMFIANTTQKVDFRAWLCEGSCGCPLTQIGALKQTTDLKYISSPEWDKLPGSQGFVVKFDDLMTDRTRLNVGTATVID